MYSSLLMKEKWFMMPFILKGATRVAPETAPSPEHVYDPQQQLWIDNRTGVPVVFSSMGTNSSRFGETTVTKTREGTDQPETGSILVSRFGETTLTDTVEGADQSEIVALASSRFGETTTTRSVEGTDNPEILSPQQVDVDAPYSHF